MMLGSLCTETLKPVSEGGSKSDSRGRKRISLSRECFESNNRGGEGGVFKDVGALFRSK